MLTNKEKKYLKGLAMDLNSILQIGKNGLTTNMLDNIDSDLAAHELVKINVLKNCDEDLKTMAIDICAYTKAELVQIIGRTIILYRKSKKEKIKF